MHNIENLYKLKIFNISEKEKEIIIDIIRDSREKRLCSLQEMEKISGFSLRYISNARINKKSDRSDFSYEKWVFLYNYVMDDISKICIAKNEYEIADKIELLHRHSMDTGRYSNDMHIFNKEFMQIDTRDAEISEDYYGYYIGFRYGSTRKFLILTVLEIYKTLSNRNVYRERVINENQDRAARGLAYEAQGILYLFGFMNHNGYEYIAVKSDSRSNEILFGISSIVDRHGTPHAKQCCLVRDFMIDGLISLDNRNKRNKYSDKTIWDDAALFTKLRENVKSFFDEEAMTVKMAGDKNPLELKRYISPNDIVRPRIED